MELEPIGVIKSPVDDGVDNNWGEVIAEVEVNVEYAPGLQGLDQFSHVIIVFFMHDFKFQSETDLVRRPRGRSDMPLLGCLAQRAKHRPNPIAVSVVELISVENNILKVKGLDAINNTPVLDIKPYFPVFDKRDNATTPEWVDRLMQGYF